MYAPDQNSSGKMGHTVKRKTLSHSCPTTTKLQPELAIFIQRQPIPTYTYCLTWTFYTCNF